MLSRPILYLLGGTLAICAYLFWQEQQSAEPELDSKAKPAERASGRIASIASEASRISSAHASSASAQAASKVSSLADLFPKQTWAPPPPPPTKPPAPTPTPIPVAPPLPLQVTATWAEKNTLYAVVDGQGQSMVLCNHCDTLGRIQPGDTLLGAYRLDSITRDVLTFTYLPLNQQQSLPTGGTP